MKKAKNNMVMIDSDSADEEMVCEESFSMTSQFPLSVSCHVNTVSHHMADTSLNDSTTVSPLYKVLISIAKWLFLRSVSMPNRMEALRVDQQSPQL